MQGPSGCGKEKSLLGRNICKSVSFHYMSVQQCLLARQNEGRGAPGVPSPYLALQGSPPHLLQVPGKMGGPLCLAPSSAAGERGEHCMPAGALLLQGDPGDTSWQQERAASYSMDLALVARRMNVTSYRVILLTKSPHSK